MWLVTVVDFCYGWSLWVFLTWLPSYLSDSRGFKLDQMALMTMLPLLAGVVGDTLGGVISDAIFRRTGNLRLARRTLLVVGLGGAFAFIVPAIVTGSALGAVCLLAAAFFFLELTNAVLWTLPIDIAGQFAGTAGRNDEHRLRRGRYDLARSSSACSSSAPVAMSCRCSSRRGCCWLVRFAR
jgi:ACS family D-galactonate transporter-like MFS transporter